jgi:hypothetical protein
MTIFISYSSKDRNTAEEISLALLGAGYEIFFDQNNLPPGGDFHSRIRSAIERSDAYIFLISNNSIKERGYALTELKFAKEKWPKPWGKVLPIMIEKVDYDLIDNYLKAITILTPTGNIAAEVTFSLEKLLKQNAENETVSEEERQVVSSLLTFLEDRRLITDDTGYQSHFPDNLRTSAEEIRERTNIALQQIDRESKIGPMLKRIQVAAKNFQSKIEGAMDGYRAGGSMGPFLPMGLVPYLQTLYEYRKQIVEGMIEAANISGFKIDSTILDNFQEGQNQLTSITNSISNRDEQ